MIWNATYMNDDEVKHSTYTVLQDISVSLPSEHLETLVGFINEIQPQNLIKAEVDLLNEVVRYPIKAGT